MEDSLTRHEIVGIVKPQIGFDRCRGGMAAPPPPPPEGILNTEAEDSRGAALES